LEKGLGFCPKADAVCPNAPPEVAVVPIAELPKALLVFVEPNALDPKALVLFWFAEPKAEDPKAEVLLVVWPKGLDPNADCAGFAKGEFVLAPKGDVPNAEVFAVLLCPKGELPNALVFVVFPNGLLVVVAPNAEVLLVLAAPNGLEPNAEVLFPLACANGLGLLNALDVLLKGLAAEV